MSYCGRRYQHYFSDYPFPNDKQQLETEAVLDYLWRITLTSMKKFHRLPDERLLAESPLFYASLGESLQDVLDIGTGNGIWAMDYGTNAPYGSISTNALLADRYPSAHVIGVDISSVQPV